MITDPGTSGNSVYADYIGTDFAGKLAVANTGNGVVIENGAAGNTIGGTTSGINVISGNGGIGVLITGSGTAGNSVQGNYIGTDSTGMSMVGNAQVGAEVAAGATNNTIGGTVFTERDVISGNMAFGAISPARARPAMSSRATTSAPTSPAPAPGQRLRRGGHR